SRALREAERREDEERVAQRERQHLRLRRSLVGLGLLTVLAVVATIVALQQRSSSQREAAAAAAAREAAETRRLVSDVPQLAPTNRRVALLLAAEAYRRQPGPGSLGAVKDALASAQHVIGYVGADIAFNDIAWTDDGRLVGTHDGGVVVLDLDGARDLEIQRMGATTLAVRPDGAVAAVAATDQAVHVLDLGNGVENTVLDHGSSLNAVTFSGDGRWLATGDRDGVVRLFDAGFRQVASFEAFAHSELAVVPDDIAAPLAHEPLTFREGAVGVALSDDGRHLAAVGGADYVVYDTTELVELHRGAVTRPDGSGGFRLATATGVGFADHQGSEVLAVTELTSTMLLDSSSGAPVDRWLFPGGLTAAVVVEEAATVANDRAVSVGDDGRVRVASADPTDTFIVDAQFGAGVAVAADAAGERVAVAGEQGALVVSLVGRGLISWSIATPDHTEFFVTTDGSTVVAGDFTLRASTVWRRAGDRYRPEPMPAPAETYSWTGLPFGFSWHEPTRMAQRRDPVTMEPVGPPLGPHGVVNPGASSDGRLVSLGGSRTSSESGELTVAVYDTVSGDVVALLDDFANDESVIARATVFSPDDRQLIVATDDGRAVVYDTSTWRAIEPVLSGGNGAVVQAAYSPDGNILATVSTDGEILFRDPETFQPIGPPLLGNTEGVQGFAFGPYFSDDGRWMFTLSDGNLRMFDVERRTLVGGPFPEPAEGAGGAARNAAFAITPSERGAIVWDLDAETWPEIACRAAGRNMTVDEWEQFGPADEPYRATCDQWPSLAEEPSTTGGES
ncbi:MAG: hypothetical protein HKN41_02995, partial [Ilumatobacter sp.]|nr:hypothetical protein [Ilumatobacter sp.]